MLTAGCPPAGTRYTSAVVSLVGTSAHTVPSLVRTAVPTTSGSAKPRRSNPLERTTATSAPSGTTRVGPTGTAVHGAASGWLAALATMGIASTAAIGSPAPITAMWRRVSGSSRATPLILAAARGQNVAASRSAAPAVTADSSPAACGSNCVA